MQRWEHRGWNFSHYAGNDNNHIKVAKCDHCQKCSLWLDDTMLYPDVGRAPQPNPDMPESVKSIYLEAASISTKSSRGASALLRLGLQILCKEDQETTSQKSKAKI